ncbi:FtsX-like permease family protein [Acetobacterium sp. KB-1]|jgi:putative ABC transport system permease protein|uniref:ABC transporter permease n=1 Tax=Acetobacterium sp. KB-1 TaxID=2184575 RepID=UPI000DBECAF8|nr:FtsX-like permease family protein [Acetobacterium sp. KB-1]AWW26963.1 hypothetical protein DOZ58_10165 [Acetobacterium sp. KB-1]
MQKILRKRILRDLKANLFYYLAPGFLIVLGMYLVVSFVGAADTVITGVAEKNQLLQVEDGQFSVFVPLTEKEENDLVAAGITLEEQFYLDYHGRNNSVVRLFKNRKAVNLASVDEGRMPVTAGEIFLEKHCARKNQLTTGSQITIAGSLFKVTGIGTLPDYDAVYQELSDSIVESETFGFGLVVPADYEMMKTAGQAIKSKSFTYAYHLNGTMDDSDLKKKLKDTYYDHNKLTAFITAANNPRIAASADDQVITKIAGLIAGVVVMILFTYIISVFVIHTIDRERPVIGALYALGVTKKDLMRYYLTLPVIITVLGGMIGTAIGYSQWGVSLQMAESLNYFSVPNLATVYSLPLLLYGIVMPAVVAAVVNALVIRKKLSKNVLDLLSNRENSEQAATITLKRFGFVRRFQIRQMIREARTSLTVVFGLFIALLIMMLGLNCYAVCSHVGLENKADTRFEYMYSYKFPTEAVPEGGVAAFGKTLKKEVFGYNLDVTLLGIDASNPYFDAAVTKGQNKVIISSAVARKFGLAAGDVLVLNDEEDEKLAAFTVDGVTAYASGLFVFMNLADMRDYFGETDTYYNIVFSDQPLNLETERLNNVTTREDSVKSANVFISQMTSLIITMVAVSLILLAVVMYLMMQVMVDRSAFGIALMKIFGYRSKELRKLYINGNFYVIAVGAVISIPLAKWVMDQVYPILVSNVAVGFNLNFPWWLYAGVYGMILFLYLVINTLLLQRLKKISHAEVLKNRE